MILTQNMMNSSAIIERRKWSKFGQAKDDPPHNPSEVSDEPEVEFEFIHEYRQGTEHDDELGCLKKIRLQIEELEKELKKNQTGHVPSWKEKAKSIAIVSEKEPNTFIGKLRSKKADEPEWRRTVFMDNMPSDYQKPDVLSLFTSNGFHVSRINMVHDKFTGDMTGKVFVVLDDEETTLKAVTLFHEMRIDHAVILCQQAHDKGS